MPELTARKIERSYEFFLNTEEIGVTHFSGVRFLLEVLDSNPLFFKSLL